MENESSVNDTYKESIIIPIIDSVEEKLNGKNNEEKVTLLKEAIDGIVQPEHECEKLSQALHEPETIPGWFGDVKKEDYFKELTGQLNKYLENNDIASDEIKEKLNRFSYLKSYPLETGEDVWSKRQFGEQLASGVQDVMEMALQNMQNEQGEGSEVDSRSSGSRSSSGTSQGSEASISTANSSDNELQSGDEMDVDDLEIANSNNAEENVVNIAQQVIRNILERRSPSATESTSSIEGYSDESSRSSDTSSSNNSSSSSIESQQSNSSRQPSPPSNVNNDNVETIVTNEQQSSYQRTPSREEISYTQRFSMTTRLRSRANTMPDNEQDERNPRDSYRHNTRSQNRGSSRSL